MIWGIILNGKFEFFQYDKDVPSLLIITSKCFYEIRETVASLLVLKYIADTLFRFCFTFPLFHISVNDNEIHLAGSFDKSNRISFV